MPSSPSRRPVFAVLTLILIFYALGSTVLGPCVTSIEHTFGVGHRAMGAMFAAGSLGYLSGVWATGLLAPRIGLGGSIRLGAVLMAASLAAIGLAPRWTVLPVSYFVFGVGGGLGEMASVSAVQGLFPERRRGALNLFQVGYGVGAILGPALAQSALRVEASWRLSFVYPALCLVPLAFLVRGPGLGRTTAPIPDHSTPPRPYLAMPALWLGSIALMCYVAGEWGVSSWSSAHFESRLGVAKADAALAPMVLWMGILLGRGAMWFVADRVSSRRIVILSAVSGGGFAALALGAPSLPMALGYLFVSGVLQAPIWPTVVDHAARRLGTHSPQALSWVVLGGGIGGLGQALVGHIAESRSLAAGLTVAVLFFFGVAAAMGLDWAAERRDARRMRLD